MSAFKGTPGPWRIVDRGIWDISIEADGTVAHVNNKGEWFPSNGGESISGRSHNTMLADARLIAAAPDLLEALHEGRRAIGDHHAPNDCYATGPVTGDAFRDLVECPACAFIAKYDAAIAKATGGAA